MSSTFSGDETAPFFGFLGAAAALVFSCMGAAYGTAKSGVGVASMGVMRPELVMKSIVPVVMAGVLGIYGLIIAVIISTGINPKAKSYYLFDGYAHLSSGLACGLAGLSAGMAIGIVGDAGVRANAQQPKLFVGMILILIFAEALALYGLIVGIILSSRAELPTDRAALDEYIGVWFRDEVPDAVELRSTTVIFRKELEERIESRRLVINHLEKVKGCPTYGWLKRLKKNHAEDLEQLRIMNVVVARMYATVRSSGCCGGCGGASGSLGALKVSIHPVIAIFLYPLGASTRSTSSCAYFAFPFSDTISFALPSQP
ncbi:V-type proton ATPase 16 kDa proteolipid subunit [Tanacetum coccineum]